MNKTKTITLVHIEEKCLEELKRLAEIGFHIEKRWKEYESLISRTKRLTKRNKRGEVMKKKTATAKKTKKTKTKKK